MCSSWCGSSSSGDELTLDGEYMGSETANVSVFRCAAASNVSTGTNEGGRTAPIPLHSTAAQVQAARDACRQRQANCEALEEAALKCLGSRMRATMSMSGDKLPWREAELRRRESEASLAASQAEAAARPGQVLDGYRVPHS